MRTYAWSNPGRTLSDGTYTYTWDAAGRLITVTDGITTLGFLYDGDGSRLARIVNGTLTTHTLDVGLALPEVLAEHQSTNPQSTLHLHPSSSSGQSLPHSTATDDDGAWTYSAADGLGSVRQRLDGTGRVLAVNGLRPFGSPLEGDGGDPYGFTGEWWEDDGGLLFLRARHYSPITGRFLSQDPWPGDANRPVTLHRFSYAHLNPVSLTDPTGLSPQVICQEVCSEWFDIELCECYCDWWSRQNHRDLTYWLVSELNANANGPEVAGIRALIEAATDPSPVLTFPKLGGNQPPLVDQSEVRLSLIAQGFMRWSNLVADGKRWDFKDATLRKLQLEDPEDVDHQSIWLQTEILSSKYHWTSGDWFEYSVPGNVHYAYVGRAAGFGVFDLHLGASYAEVTDPVHSEEAQFCLPTKFLPCFYFDPGYAETSYDEPPDFFAIEFGSKLFDTFGYSVPLEGFKVILGAYQSLLAHEAPPLDAETYVNWAWPYELGYFDGG